jgi:hypothetical protein
MALRSKATSSLLVQKVVVVLTKGYKGSLTNRRRPPGCQAGRPLATRGPRSSCSLLLSTGRSEGVVVASLPSGRRRA